MANCRGCGKYCGAKPTPTCKHCAAGAKNTKAPTANPNVTARTVDDEADDHWGLQAATTAYGQRLRELAVNTDTELATLDGDLYRALRDQDWAANSLQHAISPAYTRNRPGLSELRTQAQALLDDPDMDRWRHKKLTEALTACDNAEARVTTISARMRELDDVWRQHRWSRAFLVPNGHVHSSMDCQTCNRNGNATEFVRLPQYSGGTEDDIVNDAGERACTVCFPTAPLDVLQRPTRIFSDDERRQLEEAEARRAQREASRAAKAAKAPTASGEPLRLEVDTVTGRDGNPRPRMVELKTERAALTFAVDILAAQQSGHHYLAPYEVGRDRYERTVNAICDSIAEKRGVTRGDILAELEPKVTRKIRQYER